MMDIENKYGTLEMQKALLPLMKLFDDFCTRNDIRYTMAGGSMLGTVREHGFIPWDDDLDILLDRKNYDRLRRIIGNEPRMKMVLENYMHRIVFPEAVIGKGDRPAIIDVCVIDNVPDGVLAKKIKMILAKFMQGAFRKPNFEVYTPFQKVASVLAYMLGCILPVKVKLSLYEYIMQWGDKKDTHAVGCYNTIMRYIDIEYKPELMKKLIRMPFEDIEVSVSAEYDHYLRMQYGDYMTPPKESERVPQHM